LINNLKYSKRFSRFCTQRCHIAREKLDGWRKKDVSVHALIVSD